MDDFGFKKINPSSETSLSSRKSKSEDKGGKSSASQNTNQNLRQQTDVKKEQPAMAKKRKKIFTKKKFGISTIILTLVLLVIGYIAIRGIAIYKDEKATRAQAKVALAALKQQNVIAAKDELVKTQKKIGTLKKDVDSISFIGWIPLLGAYYNDLAHLVNASTYGVSAGIIATDAVIPYADVLGLKGQKSFVGGSAEDRIRLAVKTMGKVVPKIDDIESKLKSAKAEVDKVDPGRYPNFWVFKKVHSQISSIKTLTDDGVLAVDQGKPLIKVLPQLLGEGGEKKYLVLFQNNNELRPTGGFLTFYAIFRVEEGVIHVNNASDIYDLDNSISYHPTAPQIILDYLPKVTTFNIRDSNLSPDFEESVKTFNTFYEKSSSKQKIDGIIAIDTYMLVHTLDILGEVEVGGLKFNSKTDPRCDCPQVVYVLEDNTSRPVAYVKSNRKGIVGELLFAIMEKALKSSPKLYWGPLFQQGIKDISEKHVLFSLNDPLAQKGVEALNWAGKIDQKFDGDYLHINDANFGGQKSNLYTRSSVKVEYRISNGEITKTVTETYKNPHPYSDCGLESGGLCLNATLRNFQRLYVPKGSVLISSKGSQVKVKTTEDLGRTAFQSFFTVNPQGKAEMIYTYKLPFKVKGSTLPVLIQKQPGIDSIPFEIYVNGRKVQSFDLISDKQFSLRL